MFWTNIKRVTKAGFLNFWRNGFVSLSSVLVMTVTLFTIGSMIFLLATLDSSLTELKNKVDVNVYFVTTADESDILNVKKSLEAMPEVQAVDYISKEDALVNFRSKHKNDQLTLQALDELGSNPLGAVLNIKAKAPSQYEGIATYLKGDSGVLSSNGKSIIDEVNYYNNKVAIERLSKIINSAGKLGFIIALILSLISIIIAFNTVRLVIYISRDEISVMQLVGASNKYIRGPFVISGAMYGLAAGIITLAIFYPLTYYIGPATVNFFSGLNIFRYYLEHFSEIFGIICGSGILLGAISSYMAVRRYLKV
jgi:cell division transport system permease protein